jgi:CHAT domain-containing protein/tetratricopeptide (TPR) repeat protein
VYRSLGQRQKAVDYFNQALDLHQALGDRRGESIALNNIGATYDTMGERQKAIEYYTKSLAFRRALGDRQGEAVTLNNIALAYNNLGESQKALEAYELALPIRREVGDKRGEAITLNNIGSAYEDLGHKQKALDYFIESLSLRRAVGDQRGEAVTLSNMARVYNKLGHYQKALDHYTQALALRRTVGDKLGEANTLIGIGAVYDSLGEKQKALDHFERALIEVRKVNDRHGQAVVLNNLGKTHRSLGEYQKALEYYSQSLPLRKAIGDRRGESVTLGNIGMVYNFLGEKQKAFEFYDKALAIAREIGDLSGIAVTLDNIGSLYFSLGDKERALANYSQALDIRREVGDRQGEVTTLANLAAVESGRGNLASSQTYIEAALRLLESLRTSVANPELRSSYFASAQFAYGFYIDLLVKMDKQHPTAGHIAAAFRASEQARARSLLEMLAEAGAGIRQGVDPALLQRESALQHQLNAKAESQLRLLSGKPTEEQKSAMRKEIEGLTTEYQAVEAQIRTTSPRYAALTQPKPLSLSEIQRQVLDPDTLLLEYALGKDRSYLWAISSSSITSHELPKRADVEAAARQVYDLLTARQRVGGETEQQHRERVSKADADFITAAAGLSRMVLGPVASQLSKKTLVIVADGALQYVPFAALPAPTAGGQWSVVSGEQSKSPARTAKSDDRRPGNKNWSLTTDHRPLIADHEIVSLPSASVMAVLRRETAGRKPAAKAVAVLADPVFDKGDDRVRLQAKVGAQTETTAEASEAGRPLSGDRLQQAVREVGVLGDRGSIPRLPFSRQEADAILAVAPASATMKALGFTASRATATSSELQQYRIVHFATHGLLNTEHPELSGLVLSLVDEEGRPQDGFLRLHDLYNLKLPADLVVLSACQTGLGKEIRGEGLVGLTRGFMYAGTPRVVASLWKVDDLATAGLMKHFYQAMLKEGMRPAAALRAAQVGMLKNKQWRAPFYWAPFVLQGEWR